MYAGLEINNGLAPPNPENVIDEFLVEGLLDAVNVRNAGCGALDPCAAPGAPTTVAIVDGGVAANVLVHDPHPGRVRRPDGHFGRITGTLASGDLLDHRFERVFGNRTIRLVPVPEPGTGLLVALGLLAAGAARRASVR